MTPPPKDLTDPGEREALADDVASRLRHRERTQGPVVTSDSSARIYQISEEVVKRNRPAEWVACEKEGPACKLSDILDDHENRIESMEKARDREEGGRQFVTKVFAVLGTLGMVSGIASGWYGATHRAQAATVDVAAEIQALRAELRRTGASPPESSK
jgi:hypothetical protein